MSGALRTPVTYGELIVTALRRFPDRIAFQQDDRRLTYRQTADLLTRWIAVLTQRGLRHGEGIGVLGEMGWKDLEGDIASQPPVMRSPDDTHSAGAEQFHQLVNADPASWMHSGIVIENRSGPA